MRFILRPKRSFDPGADNATGRRLGSRIVLAASAASAVLIAACGSSASQTLATKAAATPVSAAAGVPVSAAGSPARVLVRNSNLGRIIVDGRGRTLYMFSADHAGHSTCTGMCAHFWPPYTTTGRLTGAPGVKGSLLGVVHAPNGQGVVTYRGHLLYRFLKDARAGQVNGEDMSAFGGRWDVLSPAGTRITKRHKAPATTHTAQSSSVTTQAAPPPAASTPAVPPPPATTTQAPPPPATTTHAPAPPKPSSGSGIPQGGGGDGDLDNHGGPSDGDGNV